MGTTGSPGGALYDALVAAGFERPSFDRAFTIEKRGRTYDLLRSQAPSDGEDPWKGEHHARGDVPSRRSGR